MLGPLLFLIFINDLPDGITSLCKIFADDTSLLSKVYDIDISAKELNFDLEKNSKWAFQWKMQFNPDPNKQANKVVFSRKTKNSSHPPVAFNNNVIKKYPHHKHLGIQKQPPRGILKKRFSENMHYRRTPMPKCDFNRIALQLY